MNRILIKRRIPRMLVVATLAATGVAIAAEQGGSMMSERDMQCKQEVTYV